MEEELRESNGHIVGKLKKVRYRVGSLLREPRFQGRVMRL